MSALLPLSPCQTSGYMRPLFAELLLNFDGQILRTLSGKRFVQARRAETQYKIRRLFPAHPVHTGGRDDDDRLRDGTQLGTGRQHVWKKERAFPIRVKTYLT